jgi:hypothetical protein
VTIRTLDGQTALLDADLDPLRHCRCPELWAAFGVGPDVAGQLLVTAWDNNHASDVFSGQASLVSHHIEAVGLLGRARNPTCSV